MYVIGKVAIQCDAETALKFLIDDSNYCNYDEMFDNSEVLLVRSILRNNEFYSSFNVLMSDHIYDSCATKPFGQLYQENS
jgi:hypothetical protein